MTKVVVKKLDTITARRPGPLSVGKKRVREIGGGLVTLRILDAGSNTFTADLTEVFRKNVAKARRENKLVVGKSDIAPAKR